MKEIRVNLYKLRKLMKFIRDEGDSPSPSERQYYNAVLNLLTMMHDIISLDGRVTVADPDVEALSKPLICRRRLTIPNE